MARLLIITRHYLPLHNGLADHAAFVVTCLSHAFDSIDVVCEAISSRFVTQSVESNRGQVRIIEYATVHQLFRTIGSMVSAHRYDAILFEYVPHMWGRAGVAPRIACLPGWLRLRYGVTVTTYLHELYYDWALQPKRLLLSLIHRLQLGAIGYASAALVVTNHKRQNAIRKLWRNKVFRIPAGNVSARKPDVLRERRFPWPYLTWFGTLSEHIYLEDLCTAFCELAADCCDLRLVLVGGFDVASDRIKQIQARMADAQLGDRLIVRGYVSDDELSDVLSGSLANCVLYASGPSGRRSVVAACLRSGRPLVAVAGDETDPEFLDLRNVLMVPPQDITALAASLRWLHDDVALCDQIRAGARALFGQEYADSVIASKLLGVAAYAARQTKG